MRLFSQKMRAYTELRDFGFRRAEQRTELFSRVLALVQPRFSAEYPLHPRDVQENEELFYVPALQIGCTGYIVEKSSLRLLTFGSYIGAADHLWAYYRGFALGNESSERRNDFRITAVKDKQACLKVLNRIVWSPQRNSFDSKDLDSLPLAIEDVDLYFYIKEFIAAERNDWFEFEIDKKRAPN